MKSSLPEADRHDENLTKWDAPIAIWEKMRDSPDSSSEQAIPTFRTGQVMAAEKQIIEK